LAGLTIAVDATWTEERNQSAARTFAGDRITETFAIAGNAARSSGYIDVGAGGADCAMIGALIIREGAGVTWNTGLSVGGVSSGATSKTFVV